MLWEPSGLRHPSCCSTLSASLLYISLFLNYGPILSVCLLLLLCYSIEFSLLSISPSSPCLFCSFLHRNNPKSFLLCYQVIEVQNLLRQESWCLLAVYWKILLRFLYNPHFFSSLLPLFGAPCSKMTHFSAVITPSHFLAPVHVHRIGVPPRNVQNQFLPHISWILHISLSSEFFNHLPPRPFKT